MLPLLVRKFVQGAAGGSHQPAASRSRRHSRLLRAPRLLPLRVCARASVAGRGT